MQKQIHFKVPIKKKKYREKKIAGGPGVNLHNPGPGLLGGSGELYLPVQPAWPQQGRVQDVDPVSGSDYLDVLLQQKQNKNILNKANL